jgi:hypothetical protein
VPDKDGVPQREHLLEVERQTGLTPLALQGPEFPELLDHVWSAFLSLNRTRGQGFNGPLSISYQEIKSWQELTGVNLLPWEIDVVIRLDTIFLRVLSDGRH